MFCLGEYLGSGIFSRQASVAVRMMIQRHNSSSTDAAPVPGGPLASLFRARFLDALRRRGVTPRHQTVSSSSPNESSCTANGGSNNNNILNGSGHSVWRALDGEADGLPGVEVDVYGPVSFRAAAFFPCGFALVLFPFVFICKCADRVTTTLDQ